MKKSNVKKVIATLMAVMMCLCVSNIFVLAKNAKSSNDGVVITPRNIAIIATDNSLTLGTLGKLTCFGSTDVQYGYEAEVIVELQQYNGGWGTIKTWSARRSSSSAVDEDWYVSKGYSYRLKLTHKAYNPGATSPIETIPKYSNVVQYK